LIKGHLLTYLLTGDESVHEYCDYYGACVDSA